MTEKQKAEAYVREKLPELMEIKKGAKVLLKEGKPIRATKDPLSKLVYTNEATIIGVRPDGVIFLKEVDGEFREDDFTVINRPNIFQYVEVLIKLGKKVSYKETEQSLWLECEDFSCKAYKANLTTGQPATELNYKAFNEIVGV